VANHRGYENAGRLALVLTGALAGQSPAEWANKSTASIYEPHRSALVSRRWRAARCRSLLEIPLGTTGGGSLLAAVHRALPWLPSNTPATRPASAPSAGSPPGSWSAMGPATTHLVTQTHTHQRTKQRSAAPYDLGWAPPSPETRSQSCAHRAPAMRPAMSGQVAAASAMRRRTATITTSFSKLVATNFMSSPGTSQPSE